METREIKHINILSAAKIVGLWYAAIGLVIWLIFACFGLLNAFVLGGLLVDEQAFEFVGAGIGGLIISLVIALCAFPIFYGIIGAIGGTIGALLYNLIAGWFGGLEIQFGEGGKY